MTSHTTVIKERCGGCQKFLLSHNKIMACDYCGKIVHAKCSHSQFEYDHIRNKWQCWECTCNRPKLYNPFSSVVHNINLKSQISIYIIYNILAKLEIEQILRIK